MSDVGWIQEYGDTIQPMIKSLQKVIWNFLRKHEQFDITPTPPTPHHPPPSPPTTTPTTPHPPPPPPPVPKTKLMIRFI